MDDLISRQAAIDCKYQVKIINDIEYVMLSEVQMKMRKLPSAQPEPLTVKIDHELTKDECDRLKQAMRDAPILLLPSAQPDIIRCKECEYWDTSWQNDFAPNYHYCPLVDGTRRGDFYCADAERRTDGRD